MSDSDIWETVSIVAVILIGALGVLLYLVWRLGSEPIKDDNDDYGAPHG